MTDRVDEVKPGTGPVRLIFPCTPEFHARIDAEWHRRGLMSRSETIRVLLEEALGAEGR